MNQPTSPTVGSGGWLIVTGLVLTPLVVRFVLGAVGTGGALLQLWPFVVAAIIVVEAWAFVVLVRDLASLGPGERGRGGIVVIALLLARTAVELIALMNTFVAAGYSHENPLLVMGLMILAVGKLVVCTSVSLGVTPREATPRRRTIAALVVNVWAPLAYSLCWGRLVASSPALDQAPLGEAVVQTLVAGLLFLLLYAPLRIYAILAVLRGRRRVGREAIVILGLGAAAMVSLWGRDIWFVARLAELLGNT